MALLDVDQPAAGDLQSKDFYQIGVLNNNGLAQLRDKNVTVANPVVHITGISV